MEKSSIIKIISSVLMILGVATAGVCIWVIADPVKFGNILIQTWDGGDSTKIGIAVAVLMILAGISFCLINSEGRFNFFAGALVIILALSIASMSVAIKDHQDLKKAVDILKNIPSVPKIDLDIWKASENLNLKPLDDVIKQYDKILTKLKAVAAVGGIDSVSLLVCLAVLFMNRS